MNTSRVLRAYVRVAWVGLKQYPANFLAVLAYWAVSLAVLVVFWKTLFRFLPTSLGEWDFPRLCVLNALCYVSWGLFVLFWGLHRIPEKVITGQLDKFLCRPLSPLLGLMGEDLHLVGLYEMSAGLVALAAVGIRYSVLPRFGGLLAAAFALAAGTLAVALVHGVVSLLSFWIGRVDSIQGIVDSVDEFQRYPAGIFPGGLQRFLTFMVPVYFPGTFAARLYLGLPVASSDWAMLGEVFLGWLTLFLVLYRACRRRYEANG